MKHAAKHSACQSFSLAHYENYEICPRVEAGLTDGQQDMFGDAVTIKWFGPRMIEQHFPPEHWFLGKRAAYKAACTRGVNLVRHDLPGLRI